MNTFFLYVNIFLGVLVLACLYRVVIGPTTIDRMIAVSAIGTKTLVLLILIGFIFGRVEMFVDICTVYALLNFLGTLAATKYFEERGKC